MSPEFVTILLAVFSMASVVLGKAIEQRTPKATSDAQAAATFREQLMKQIETLNARCDRLEADLDEERKRSETEHEARIEAERLRDELAAANDKLSNECATMRQRIAALEKEVADLKINSRSSAQGAAA